jgi:hypothetical protein
MVAYEIGAGDLATTRRFLEERGIPMARSEAGLAARLPDGVGGTILFRQADP